MIIITFLKSWEERWVSSVEKNFVSQWLPKDCAKPFLLKDSRGRGLLFAKLERRIQCIAGFIPTCANVWWSTMMHPSQNTFQSICKKPSFFHRFLLWKTCRQYVVWSLLVQNWIFFYKGRPLTDLYLSLILIDWAGARLKPKTQIVKERYL